MYTSARMSSSGSTTLQGAGPIRDYEAARVCSLSGIGIAKGKLTTLQQLRDGLNISIQTLDAEQRTDHLNRRALLVLRFTKASCDAFISMAKSLSEVLLPESASKGAKAVATFYGTATPLVEAASTSIAGGKTDWVKAGASSAKAGASYIDNKGYELLTKSTVVKVELIHGAMNEDKEGLLKTAISYLYDLHTAIAEIADAKKTAAFAEIAKSAFEYNEQVGNAFEELLEGDVESRTQYLSLKATISHQARQLSRTIGELEKFITSCELELSAPQTAPRLS